MIYFCDFTKPAQEEMEKLGVGNDEIQCVFNEGMSEGLNRKFLDRDGYRIGVLFHYDGYTLRYVVESVYKRPLKTKYAEKVLAKNRS